MTTEVAGKCIISYLGFVVCRLTRKVYKAGIVRIGHEAFQNCLQRIVDLDPEEKSHLKLSLSGNALGVAGSGQFCHLGDEGAVVIPHDWSIKPWPRQPFPQQRYACGTRYYSSKSGTGDSGNGTKAADPTTVPSTTDEQPQDEIQIPGAQAGGKKLAIVYTCTVCNTRSIKQFSEHSYQNGVVLVRCPGCQNLHLIADRLGMFEDKGVDGSGWDVEAALAKLGENVNVVTNDNVMELSLEDLIGKDATESITTLSSIDSDTERSDDDSISQSTSPSTSHNVQGTTGPTRHRPKSPSDDLSPSSSDTNKKQFSTSSKHNNSK